MRVTLHKLVTASERYLRAQQAHAFRPGPKSFSGARRAEISLRYAIADARAELGKRAPGL